jgi:hypothetical protein
VLSGTRIEIETEGEKPVGVITLEYDVLYVTSIIDPETAL